MKFDETRLEPDIEKARRMADTEAPWREVSKELLDSTDVDGLNKKRAQIALSNANWETDRLSAGKDFPTGDTLESRKSSVYNLLPEGWSSEGLGEMSTEEYRQWINIAATTATYDYEDYCRDILSLRDEELERFTDDWEHSIVHYRDVAEDFWDQIPVLDESLPDEYSDDLIKFEAMIDSFSTWLHGEREKITGDESILEDVMYDTEVNRLADLKRMARDYEGDIARSIFVNIFTYIILTMEEYTRSANNAKAA